MEAFLKMIREQSHALNAFVHQIQELSESIPEEQLKRKEKILANCFGIRRISKKLLSTSEMIKILKERDLDE